MGPGGAPPPAAAPGANDSDLRSAAAAAANATALNASADARAPPAGPHEPAPHFTDSALIVVCVYAALFVVAAVGNLTVFVSLVRGRRRKSRISLMITHLALADLLVTFVMMPLEIGWRLTTQWVAGNAACKLFLFLRAFGLYLSSNVLVCVSLDRYFAVLHPLKVNDARRRGKVMLAFAWFISLVCSAPQSVVFHVSQHPEYPDFYQCVSFGFFRSQVEETAYNLFCVFAMYFVPLFVICFAYSCILFEITSKSRETKDRGAGGGGGGGGDERLGGRLRLRRSDMSNIERARARTLRMTITIVAAFIWCWTPYVVMTLWYMFDRESARQVDSRVQDALFIMAVSNSCMNPLVYGSYALNCRRDCARCCACALRPTPTDPLMRKSTVGSATRSTAAANGNSLTTAAALGVGAGAGAALVGAGVGRGPARLLPDVLPAYRQRGRSRAPAAAAALGPAQMPLLGGGGGGAERQRPRSAGELALLADAGAGAAADFGGTIFLSEPPPPSSPFRSAPPDLPPMSSAAGASPASGAGVGRAARIWRSLRRSAGGTGSAPTPTRAPVPCDAAPMALASL